MGKKPLPNQSLSSKKLLKKRLKNLNKRPMEKAEKITEVTKKYPLAEAMSEVTGDGTNPEDVSDPSTDKAKELDGASALAALASAAVGSAENGTKENEKEVVT